jgi:hypothetical protein
LFFLLWLVIVDGWNIFGKLAGWLASQPVIPLLGCNLQLVMGWLVD